MKTKHTAGPWALGEQTINEHGVVVTGIDAPNAEPNEITNLANVFGDNEEDEANARLIASAPELLELLKEYARLHKSMILNKMISPALGSPIRIKAEKLISKAEGNESDNQVKR